MKKRKSDIEKLKPWRYRIICAGGRILTNIQYAESLEKADEMIQRFIQRDCWSSDLPLYCWTFLDNENPEI